MLLGIGHFLLIMPNQLHFLIPTGIVDNIPFPARLSKCAFLVACHIQGSFILHFVKDQTQSNLGWLETKKCLQPFDLIVYCLSLFTQEMISCCFVSILLTKSLSSSGRDSVKGSKWAICRITNRISISRTEYQLNLNQGNDISVFLTILCITIEQLQYTVSTKSSYFVDISILLKHN